jgi:hypothetical protein
MEEVLLPPIEVSIMSGVVGPNNPDLPPEAARALLTLRFDEAALQRMNALAEKNRQATLSDKEQAEMQGFLRVGHLLNLLQAKAHLSLKRQGDAK